MTGPAAREWGAVEGGGAGNKTCGLWVGCRRVRGPLSVARLVRETPVRAASRRGAGDAGDAGGAGDGGGAAECKAPPTPYEWLNT